MRVRYNFAIFIYCCCRNVFLWFWSLTYVFVCLLQSLKDMETRATREVDNRASAPSNASREKGMQIDRLFVSCVVCFLFVGVVMLCLPSVHARCRRSRAAVE